MWKFNLFLFFILITGFSFGQNGEIKNHGTIKISKPSPDSIYIKAVMNFQIYQDGNNPTSPKILIQVDKIIAPFPSVSGFTNPFDYTLFFNKAIGVKKSDLSVKGTDTIHIQVKVLDKGRAYLKDITPLLVLNGVPAYYDKKMNAYKLDAIHWKCLNALKQIKEWEPAYIVVGEKEKFKRTVVIKPKKKKISATGILTIVFSPSPFEE
jgi:hypothetical protein